jgi:hypothetical protein
LKKAKNAFNAESDKYCLALACAAPKPDPLPRPVSLTYDFVPASLSLYGAKDGGKLTNYLKINN